MPRVKKRRTLYDNADSDPVHPEPEPRKEPALLRVLTPWLSNLGVTEYENKEQRLHDEVVAFVTYVLPTAHERTARTLLVDKIRDIARMRFARCEVTVFGSVAQDLCLPNGDIDIVIQTSQVWNDNYKRKALFQLASMFKDAYVTSQTHVAAGARVPVLSFESTPLLGSFHVDISLNTDDGLRALPVIKDYLSRMPALKPLALVIKTYMAIQGLNAPAFGGLGSYAILCMLICFLKLNPKGRPKEYFDNPALNESLGQLLIDFFQFYAFDFHYETSYISPASGKLLAKDSVDWVGKGRPDSLSIECLVNPGRDIGKAASKIDQIRSAFRDAYFSLNQYTLTPINYDVLGSIVGFSEQTVSYRQRIDELVGSGRFERELRRATLPAHSSAPGSSYGRGSQTHASSNRYAPYSRPDRGRRR